MKGVWLKAGIAACGLAMSQLTVADTAYPLQTSMGLAAPGVFQLNNLIMLVCLGTFVAVFAAMFYSLLRHRKSVGSETVHFHRNTLVEVAWAAVPFIILMSVAYPATRTVINHHAGTVDVVQLVEQRVASR
jgi:cytochrome c oxidase subunit 2